MSSSSSHTELDSRGAEVRDLTWDLACADGALSEIATCWRRSLSRLPGLPPGLPLRLQDSARRIEADARSLAGAARGQAPGPALDLAERFAEFRREVACARTMTDRPGGAEAGDALAVGDALLWDTADAALDRAGDRLLHLLVDIVTPADSPSGPPTAPGSRPRPTVLLVALNPDDV